MNKERIESMNVPFEYKGKQWVACVSLSVVADDDIDLSWMEPSERAETERQLFQGALTAKGIIVEAEAFGETGEDSLFGCLIENSRDIITQARDNDMINNAIDALKKAISAKEAQLAPLGGK